MSSTSQKDIHYFFDPNSQTAFAKTNHKTMFKCKIMGVPKPQYRYFATTKGKNTKVKLFNPSKKDCKEFQTAITNALHHAKQSDVFTLQQNPVGRVG